MDIDEEYPRRKPWNHHNFTSIPTINFNWGTQRRLRCVKPPEFTHPDSRKRPRSSSSSDEDAGGIRRVREKLMLDFRAEVDKLQSEFLGNEKPDTATRPWNLRTRRAVCDRKPGFLADVECPLNKSGDEKGTRPKFSVSLSKKEIEEDFVLLTGARPARRPKKRPKYVQRQIDAMFPGFWLTEVTADMYKVNEQPSELLKK